MDHDDLLPQNLSQISTSIMVSTTPFINSWWGDSSILLSWMQNKKQNKKLEKKKKEKEPMHNNDIIYHMHAQKNQRKLLCLFPIGSHSFFYWSFNLNISK